MYSRLDMYVTNLWGIGTEVFLHSVLLISRGGDSLPIIEVRSCWALNLLNLFLFVFLSLPHYVYRF